MTGASAADRRTMLWAVIHGHGGELVAVSRQEQKITDAELAILRSRVDSIQHELAEHKRICESHKEAMQNMREEFIRMSAESKPWVQMLEKAVLAMVTALLGYLAWKIGLQP